MTDHPITPTPKLVQQWANSSPIDHSYKSWAYELFIAHQAARWGADMELEACCNSLNEQGLPEDSIVLQLTRRPKPPSLKEQALKTFDKLAHLFNGYGDDGKIVRRALEALPE